MRAKTIEAARYHASRMDPRDDPRIFARLEGSETVYCVCANDARPPGGWLEVRENVSASDKKLYREIARWLATRCGETYGSGVAFDNSVDAVFQALRTAHEKGASK
jgi:hypothetical protein